MEEKYMVNDVLECTKNLLKTYQEGIIECQNIELRELLQSVRNNLEKYQYELFKIAEAKGYYQVAKYATKQEIEDLKNDNK